MGGAKRFLKFRKVDFKVKLRRFPQHKITGDADPAVFLDHLPEGIVDGLLNQDGIPLLRKAPDRAGDRVDDAGGDRVPAAVDADLVAVCKPLFQCIIVGAVGICIAKEAAICALL